MINSRSRLDNVWLGWKALSCVTAIRNELSFLASSTSQVAEYSRVQGGSYFFGGGLWTHGEKRIVRSGVQIQTGQTRHRSPSLIERRCECLSGFGRNNYHRKLSGYKSPKEEERVSCLRLPCRFFFSFLSTHNSLTRHGPGPVKRRAIERRSELFFRSGRFLWATRHTEKQKKWERGGLGSGTSIHI